MKIAPIIFLLLLPVSAFGQVAVIDSANLATARSAQIENIAKWTESLSRLRTQIDQLNQQIHIQSEIRKWAGDPVEAKAKTVLNHLGQEDLVRQYGRTQRTLLGLVGSLESLHNTVQGNYRAISSIDLSGESLQRDQLTYRRYAVLDAKQVNSEQVAEETQEREDALQGDVAATLEALKNAETDAEVQKLAGKLTALNGQLGQVEAARRREVDHVTLQKIANDSRKEQEAQAAAELEARDDFLANQRVTAYMKTLQLRIKRHEN